MIRLENVSKYYSCANAVVPALKAINIEFDIGEFIAITGESGSGKSTLLNIISGMDSYDDGELNINGEETSFYDDSDWEEYRKNKIGFVYQNYNLIENYSALYNVESSLLIQGYKNNEARKIAKKLLKRVGLEGKLHEKAVNLSSGQKQRLSIARALAKNTDIIVADEPTGNLDSETGKQIMELFSELSKDRLIIVVTHNYEEAAPYVTRKIRLHDGEVVSDEPVNKINYKVKKPDAQRDTSNMNSDRHIAASFAWMNITTQPRRVLFFMLLFLIASAVSYIFLGEIYSNWDDTFVKKYNDAAFLNGDTTRIVVKKKDGSDITEADMKNFKEIKHVRMAEQYGFCSDINYYIKKGTDYDYTYSSYSENGEDQDSKTVEFLDSSHFMKSSTCIDKEDLRAGTLPKGRYEVVLYAKDDSNLGKEMLCYYTSKNIWGYSQFYSTTVKVVGILKKKTDQVFFSEELCNMLSACLYGDSYQLSMCWDMFKAAYTEKMSFIPVISDKILDAGDGMESLTASRYLILSESKSPLGDAQLDLFHGGNEGDSNSDFTLKVNLSENNNFSPEIIEMSRGLFYKLFSHKSRQASLYTRDYIDTDYVLNKLHKLGYIAISSYRISSVAYDNEKVMARNAIIVKAILVLLIMGILEIIIINTVFKIRIKDFIVLKSMGMSWKTMRLMNLLEMLIYTIASIIVVPVVLKVVSLFHIHYLQNIVKYYNVPAFLFYIILNLFVILGTVGLFDRYLKRKQKWS